MRLNQAGELTLLKKLKDSFRSADSGVIIGIGDDAAVIAPQNRQLLVTTDMMNEGVHFDLGFTSAFQLGFKLVSVNVSDIFAMGGVPKYLFLDISMKETGTTEFFDELYEGIANAMKIYGLSLLGGDLTGTMNDMALSATVIGTTEKAVLRKGASVGDKIYVTGTLGDSACGLELLKKMRPEYKEHVRALRSDVSKKLNGQLSFANGPSHITLDFVSAGPLIRRHLMPLAREASSIAGVAASMIDISDGLFIDLSRICDESGTGARIYLDRLPLSDGLKQACGALGLDALRFASSGGEDYELLFTAPADADMTGICATCIGEIIEKERIAVDASGREEELKAEGYQHFGAG
ncbi:MAG: thiamine-phosphate kinase [Nitrospirae bacterium]|nr:MAG: thiamine-phosphate kinase [Nitrospirota bacterium]